MPSHTDSQACLPDVRQTLVYTNSHGVKSGVTWELREDLPGSGQVNETRLIEPPLNEGYSPGT